MRAVEFALVLSILVHAVPGRADAQYDGSTLMKCAIQTVLVCDDPSVCVRGTAQTVSLPAVMQIDVGKRLISGDASGRTATITSTNRNNGRLMMHGTETGLGYVGGTIVIMEESGRMLAAVVGREGGSLMFGKCGM